MFKRFIQLQWKESTRSPMWQKNVVANIFIGFFIFLMFIYLIALGILVDRIIREIYPDDNPVAIFNGFLIYYFLVDMVIRFYLQPMGSFSVESFLHLPIKKSTVVNFVAMRTITSVFNFLPFLVFIPFAIISVSVEYSTMQAWVWFMSLLFLVFFNNFLVGYSKRQLSSQPKVVGIFALVLALIMFLDYFNVFSLSEISSNLFAYILETPFMVIVPLGLLLFIYMVNFRFLRARLYPEEINVKKHRKMDSLGNISYLKSLGKTGSIIALELKLIWRNKRTRTIVYMAPLFLLYGFFFYPQDMYSSGFTFLIFVGVFMTGGMMLNYVNYAFAYESNYFDTILTNDIDIDQYIRVKFINALLIASTCFIITIPYLFFGWKILLINFVTYLYNVGFLVFVLLYMATYNKTRMEMSSGSAFNYQGIGASNWLAMIPAFFLPILVYLPFRLAGYPYAGLMAIGVLGISGLVFHRPILRIIRKQFNKRKYIMAEGFRSK